MIKKDSFGNTQDRAQVSVYTLTNKQGAELRALNYGAIVQSLRMPDRNDIIEDVILGFDTLAQYEKESPFFGAVVGRYANRIARGRFELDGVAYTLAVNNGPNHLHGGIRAFDKVLWEVSEEETSEGPSLHFRYVSADGEEGYPGELTAIVSYILSHDNEFIIRFSASTNKKTVINLSHHNYYNLSGNTRRDVLAHEVFVNADQIVAIDETSIPTGELKPVAGTPFDFTQAKPIGRDINKRDDQLLNGQGYDHTFVFHPSVKRGEVAATLYDPQSGRLMEVFTDQPGVQFYSGNFLKGYRGKYGAVYEKRYGMCLETQHFPDSPNQPSFPSVVLNPGEEFRSQSSYRFTTRP